MMTPRVFSGSCRNTVSRTLAICWNFCHSPKFPFAFWELYPVLKCRKQCLLWVSTYCPCLLLYFSLWNLLVIYLQWQTFRNAPFRNLTKCLSLYHPSLLRNKRKPFIELETFPFKQSNQVLPKVAQRDSFLNLLRPKWWKAWVSFLQRVPRTLLWGHSLQNVCIQPDRQ